MATSALLGIGTAVTLLGFYSFMWWLGGPHIERAHEMLRNGAFLIDIDEPQEFVLDHMEGATNIPLTDLARRAHEIGPFDHPVVVCGHGRLRVSRAAHELRGMGFQDVVNVGRVHW